MFLTHLKLIFKNWAPIQNWPEIPVRSDNSRMFLNDYIKVHDIFAISSVVIRRCRQKLRSSKRKKKLSDLLLHMATRKNTLLKQTDAEICSRTEDKTEFLKLLGLTKVWMMIMMMLLLLFSSSSSVANYKCYFS